MTIRALIALGLLVVFAQPSLAQQIFNPVEEGATGAAPDDGAYWVGAPNGTLTAEKDLSGFTGLVLNTVGTPSQYAGTSCTNQVLRLLDTSGAGTCITITSSYIDSSIVPSTRNVNTTAPLSGGGALSGDLTLTTSMATSRILGRVTAGTGVTEELTAAQTLTLLGAFSVLNVQVFTTPGANTYTPTSGMKYVLAITTGAGGGGGGADAAAAADVGAGSGGGAGGTAIEFFTAATIGASQTCTVGTGGTAGSGTNGTNGGTGGDTTFGALHTGVGGAGGTGSGNAAKNVQALRGGAGGVPTGGTANITGGDGHGSTAILTIDATDGNEVAFANGGNGGASWWGSGGRGGANAQDGTAADSTAGSQAGTVGAAPGAGGGGGAVLNTATGVDGGAGANGICMVIEFS